MAISGGLDYPNINFVPLETLTASELNQIVSNVNKINNAFPVSGNNLGNSSVGAGKLDWNMFGVIAKEDDGNYAIVGANTQGTVASISMSGLPTGSKFIVMTEVGANCMGNLNTVSARINYNSNTSNYTSTSGTWLVGLTVFGLFTKVAGQNTVTIQVAKTDTSSVTYTHSRTIAFRIG